MANVPHVDESNFETEINAGSTPVLVDFYAEWCPPCKKLGPIIEEVAGEMAEQLKVVKVNVQEANPLATKFGVMNIPTLILFKDGEEVWRNIGFKAKKALVRELQAQIS